MKFVYPYMLSVVLFVPLACAFWWFLRARAENRLRSLNSSPMAVRARLLDRFQMPLMAAGLALMAFAASRPQWGKSMQVSEAKSRNVVVALDVSRSMLAEDVRPNRLERAKADIADLMDSLDGDRCALVAFRRTGVLLCPLTSDYAFLRSALENATPESAPRGETDLGSAIRASLDALDPALDDHNAIILISDGGDLRGNALDAAQAARKRNVPIFTVGLGDSRKESTLPDASGSGRMKYKDQDVKVKLEDATLSAVAKASGGRYVPLATAGTAETTLGAIYRRFLRQVAAKEQAEEEELRATERFHLFLIPGLFLVIMAAACSRGRFAGRTSRNAAVAALAVVALALPLRADEGGEAGEQEAEDMAKRLISAPIVAQPVQPGQQGEDPSEQADGQADEQSGEADQKRPAEEAAYEPPPDLTDSEIWNIGYDFWKEKNYTNALSTLRPLMLSRTHGPRAAELVGVMTEDPEERAAAMQIALRASPDDARVNRNFTRAVDRLPELREAKHVEEVMKKYGQQPPDRLLGMAAKDARAILGESRSVLTNEAHAAVAKSEALAKRAEGLADIWIPVKQFVVQNVTNEQQAAVIVGDIESARDATRKAVDQLADMEMGSDESIGVAENAFTRFWKMTVMPPEAVDEGMLCQTNTLAGAEEIGGRPWQGEALDFTRAFRAKFPAWAQQYEQQAQSDTNKPPFTKEQQAEISALATEAEKLQIELNEGKVEEKDLESRRRDALAKLMRISELMPKDKNTQNNQSQQQNQPQNKDQQQNKDDKKDNQDNQQNQDQPQDQQQDQEQQQDQQQDKDDKKEQQDKGDATDEEIEAMMKKAEERNDEHEREKRARMKRVPLPPNERDW